MVKKIKLLILSVFSITNCSVKINKIVFWDAKCFFDIFEENALSKTIYHDILFLNQPLQKFRDNIIYHNLS